MLRVQVNAPPRLHLGRHHHLVIHILHLQHQPRLHQIHPVRQRRHALADLQRRGQHFSLADRNVRQFSPADLRPALLQLAGISRQVPRRLRLQRDARLLTKAQPHRHVSDRVRAHRQSGLIHPGVAGALDGGDHIHHALAGLAVVVEIPVPDVQGSAAIEGGALRHLAALHGAQRGHDLEGGRRRILAKGRPRVERLARVCVQFLKHLVLDPRHPHVEIETGIRRQRQDVTRLDIHHHKGAAIARPFFERVLGILLDVVVQCRHHMPAGHGAAQHFFGEQFALGAVELVHHAGSSREITVKGRLQPFPPFQLLKQRVAIRDRPQRQGTHLADVADDMTGAVTFGVIPHVGGLDHEAAAQMRLQLVHVLIGQLHIQAFLNGKDQRQPAAVLVVAQQLVRLHRPAPSQHTVRGADLLLRIGQDLFPRRVLHEGEIQRQIVHYPRLRQRHAMPVHDLAARGRDAQRQRPRLALRLPGRFQRLCLGRWLLHLWLLLFVLDHLGFEDQRRRRPLLSQHGGHPGTGHSHPAQRLRRFRFHSLGGQGF